MEKVKIKNRKKNKWYRSLTFRTVLASGSVILLCLVLYLIVIIPFQRESAIERMEIEANGLASSIAQIITNAIVIEDYAFAVGHCSPIVSENNSIEYIVISKNDGFSLTHSKNNWRADTLGGIWTPGVSSSSNGFFRESELVGQEVYHYSYKFEYSGIRWGWIHVGLNLDTFNEKNSEMITTSILLAFICVLIGLTLDVYVATRYSRSIKLLDQSSKKIAEGDLSGHVEIHSASELESLANSFNIMTSNLARARDELEQSVRERTKELAEANKSLQDEINVRIEAESLANRNNLRLEALQDIYLGILKAKSSTEIIRETLLKLNQVFTSHNAGAAIFNYNDDTALILKTTTASKKLINESHANGLKTFASFKVFNHKDCYSVDDLASKADKSEVENVMMEMYGTKSYMCAALRFQNKLLGEINIGSDKKYAFTEEDMEILGQIASQLAVAIEQATMKDELKTHADSLQTSLSEKVVLLKEIHHRVKNNMQIISSLLYLQSKHIKKKETLAIFRDSQNRIKSMALVHEKLYQSKDFSNINFSEYIKNLVSYINQSYLDLDQQVEIIFRIEKTKLSIDTSVPCGLIINELVSNSFKYAFPLQNNSKNQSNKITIMFNKTNDEYVLIVKDNGIGFPDNLNIKEAKSLGLQLVSNLITQIDGKAEFKNENGAYIKILFTDNS